MKAINASKKQIANLEIRNLQLKEQILENNHSIQLLEQENMQRKQQIAQLNHDF
jgi:hypothetical protein